MSDLPRRVYPNRLAQALLDAGVITPADHACRVVIDIDYATVYVERVPDELLLGALRGFKPEKVVDEPPTIL